MQSYVRRLTGTSRNWKPYATITSLHVLFWLSIAAFLIVVTLLAKASGDGNLRAAAILLMISSLSTLVYIFLHCLIALRRIEEQEGSSIFKRPVYIAIRLAAVTPLLWLLTSGWSLVLAARRPICLPASEVDGWGQWQTGTPCVVHRLSTCISLVALIASVMLFCVAASDHHPFETHLLGRRKLQESPEADDEKVSEVTGDAPKVTYFARSDRMSSLPLNTARHLSLATRSPIISNRNMRGLGIVVPPSNVYFRHSSIPLSATSIATTQSNDHSRTQSFTSNYTGLTLPMSPYRRLPAGYMPESAWRALHPPMHHFAPGGIPTDGMPAGLAPWYPPVANGYYYSHPASLGPASGGLRTPARHSTMSHSRSHSAAYSRNISTSHSRNQSLTSMHTMYTAPNGTSLRSSVSSRSLTSRSSTGGSNAVGGASSGDSSSNVSGVNKLKQSSLIHQRSTSTSNGSETRTIQDTPLQAQAASLQSTGSLKQARSQSAPPQSDDQGSELAPEPELLAGDQKLGTHLQEILLNDGLVKGRSTA